jgi:hypothetical protein
VYILKPDIELQPLGYVSLVEVTGVVTVAGVVVVVVVVVVDAEEEKLLFKATLVAGPTTPSAVRPLSF